MFLAPTLKFPFFLTCPKLLLSPLTLVAVLKLDAFVMGPV